MVVATDWTTIASLATALGTLVLAIATFSAVRSANRSTRLAERAMLAGIRPLLLASRLGDPLEKVTWADTHYTRVEGGRAALELENDQIYLAGSLRNVGTGLALLFGWHLEFDMDRVNEAPPPPEEFRRLQRDLYVAPGDRGFWQGAIRDPEDPCRKQLELLLKEPERFTVDILYGDQEGGQRTITRFGVTPFSDDGWLFVTSRHFFVDRDDPR